MPRLGKPSDTGRFQMFAYELRRQEKVHATLIKPACISQGTGENVSCSGLEPFFFCAANK